MCVEGLQSKPKTSSGSEWWLIIKLFMLLCLLSIPMLLIKIWDGGEGKVKEPFKINGHPYSMTSRKAVHDVVFTIAEVNPEHLKPGKNQINLLSDTEHHGIEVLLPGPVLIACYKE